MLLVRICRAIHKTKRANPKEELAIMTKKIEEKIVPRTAYDSGFLIPCTSV